MLIEARGKVLVLRKSISQSGILTVFRVFALVREHKYVKRQNAIAWKSSILPRNLPAESTSFPLPI